MAKRKIRRRKRSFTLPLGIIAPMATTGMAAWEYGHGAGQTPEMGLKMTADYIGLSLTGYSFIANDWKAWRLKCGLLPIGIGFMAHKVAGRLGLNRALANAGVPIIRI